MGYTHLFLFFKTHFDGIVKGQSSTIDVALRDLQNCKEKAVVMKNQIKTLQQEKKEMEVTLSVFKDAAHSHAIQADELERNTRDLVQRQEGLSRQHVEESARAVKMQRFVHLKYSFFWGGGCISVLYPSYKKYGEQCNLWKCYLMIENLTMQ